MNEPPATFGRSALAAASPAELIELERQHEQGVRFHSVDSLLADVVVKAISGQRVATFDKRRGTVNVPALHENGAVLIDDFTVGRQQARGAWYVPEEASLKVGRLNFFHYLVHNALGVTDLAQGEGGKASLTQSPDGLLIWALFEPLMDILLLPFDLRGRWAGEKSKEEQQKLWAQFEAFAHALGFDVEDELRVMRYGGGWSRLRATEQRDAKLRLARALAEQTGAETMARYRAWRSLGLMNRYYKKAKASGQATMRQVLTRAEQRTLSAFFGGDWLAFLAYLGEQPHPDEQITTALPETHFYGAGTTKVADVAAAEGLPVEEIERMLAAYWNQGAGKSPIERRIAALHQFWGQFDALHAKQRSGQQSLWGLIEQERISRNIETGSDLQPGLYRGLLPAELLRAMDELWGAMVIPRWPDRIVSSNSPHALMVEAFGPALSFWQGCALAAWFISEGPNSRTDMAHLAAHHSDDLKAMAELGCPVDKDFFKQLIAAEAKLPPAEPMYESLGDEEVDAGDGLGLSISFSMSRGSRRGGFDGLRDLVTRGRREWAERYLAAYLRGRWESEVRRAGREYSRLTAEKGKPPTAKQYAKHGAEAANHWFAGDIAALMAALGEKSPIQPQRQQLLPADRMQFVQTVYSALGGQPLRRRDPSDYEDVADHQKWRLMDLAEQSIRFVQLQEVFGREPELAEFGRRKFEWIATEIWGDVDRGWAAYSQAIRAALLARSRQWRSSSWPQTPREPASLPRLTRLQTAMR